tara:strand:+ start:356 stop:760 length:405 start_codon:yes stop_codon:yes gene_type:complete
MAGSISVSTTKDRAGVVRYAIDWLTDASGDVDTTTFDAMDGTIIQVEFTPDSGGTQPSNNYDLTILDEHGADVLNGEGSNLSNTDAEHAVPLIGSGANINKRWYHHAGTLQPVVANGGNAKGGITYLYIAPGAM